MSQQEIRNASRILRSASHVMALTGAGISTPSGIPDFRSPSSGLWQQVDPFIVASIWGFQDTPTAFYRWFVPLARQIRHAQPNPAHHALAEWEHKGLLPLIVTQNIDGLHQAAGSSEVVELHGHLRSASCLSCRQQVSTEILWPLVERGQIIHCEACNGLVKPDVILFGEPLEYENLRKAQQAALECDVVIAVGSSLEVEPAADLPYLAKRQGAKIILINREPTRADSIADVVIRGDAATILPALAHACR
ncbi:MAG: NAD-dependent deacylase [Chloroflexota bacterium]|nr:NAD-dependent deacylase [Chloroflexota bacterium]